MVKKPLRFVVFNAYCKYIVSTYRTGNISKENENNKERKARREQDKGTQRPKRKQKESTTRTNTNQKRTSRKGKCLLKGEETQPEGQEQKRKRRKEETKETQTRKTNETEKDKTTKCISILDLLWSRSQKPLRFNILNCGKGSPLRVYEAAQVPGSGRRAGGKREPRGGQAPGTDRSGCRAGRGPGTDRTTQHHRIHPKDAPDPPGSTGSTRIHLVDPPPCAGSTENPCAKTPK